MLWTKVESLPYYQCCRSTFKTGPVAGAVACRIGSRYLVVFGGMMYGLGLTLASTANSIILLGVSLIVMAGMSMSFHFSISNDFH